MATNITFYRVSKDKKLKKIIGIHLFCPNSSEIIQGFALAMSKGINLKDISNVIGVHPTLGEELFSGGVNIRTNPKFSSGNIILSTNFLHKSFLSL